MFFAIRDYFLQEGRKKTGKRGVPQEGVSLCFGTLKERKRKKTARERFHNGMPE